MIGITNLVKIKVAKTDCNQLIVTAIVTQKIKLFYLFF